MRIHSPKHLADSWPWASLMGKMGWRLERGHGLPDRVTRGQLLPWLWQLPSVTCPYLHSIPGLKYRCLSVSPVSHPGKSMYLQLVDCPPRGLSGENPVMGQIGLAGQTQVCGDPAQWEAGTNFYSCGSSADILVNTCMLGTALHGFRSCKPPWLRLSERPWSHKPLRRQSLSPWQGRCLCPLYFTLLGPLVWPVSQWWVIFLKGGMT